MIATILTCAMVSFLITLVIIPLWIRKARKAGLVEKDINKYKKPNVAEAGGVIAIAGFMAGILAYIAIKTFYWNNSLNMTEILAAMIVVLITTIIGFVDDILGWKMGLSRWSKPLFCIFAAIPLIVINAGHTDMSIPFFGVVNIGLLYPLLIIPLAVTVTANGFNMLAGYNGLEAGQGIIIFSTLGIITSSIAPWVSLISFCAAASLAAFLFFNRYPSKVFGGDVLTYGFGSLIAIIAILGNVEKAALILFIPYFIEFFMKARGKMKKQSHALPNKDNSLEIKEGIYGLEHLMIAMLKKIKPSGKVYEKEVVFGIWTLQILLSIITLMIFL